MFYSIGKIHYSSDGEDSRLIQLGRFTMHPFEEVHNSSYCRFSLSKAIGKIHFSSLFRKIHYAFDWEDASQSIDYIACRAVD